MAASASVFMFRQLDFIDTFAATLFPLQCRLVYEWGLWIKDDVKS